jgi:hypothetical protein
MYNSYNKVFFEYYEYIIDILNMCLTDIVIECFPWVDKKLENKPDVILKKSNFERYYDSEDSLDKEYDLV